MTARKFYPANKHYSSDELKEIARAFGWTVDESKGKGSHAWVSKEGYEGFPIPRKVNSKVQDEIKKRLGLK